MHPSPWASMAVPLWLVLGIGFAGCGMSVPTRPWVPPAGLAGPASCPVGEIQVERGSLAGTSNSSDLSVVSLWVERPGGTHEEGWIRLRRFADPCRQGDLRWSRIRLESAFDTLEFDRTDSSPLVEIDPHGPWGEPTVFLHQVQDPDGMQRLAFESTLGEFGTPFPSTLVFRTCMDPDTRSFEGCGR